MGRTARTRRETISRPTLGWRVTPAIRPTPPRYLPIASAARAANHSLWLYWSGVRSGSAARVGGPSSEPRMAVLRRLPRPFGHRLRLRVLAVFGIWLCERPSGTAWRRRARLRNVTGHWISSAPDPPFWRAGGASGGPVLNVQNRPFWRADGARGVIKSVPGS